MKALRRQQKDIDKARGQLFGWATNTQEGTNGIARILNELISDVAQQTQLPSSTVQTALANDPYATVTRVVAMVNWLTGADNTDQKETPLARYIRERARRESSTGRRWLQQLAASRYELREVLKVTPDTSLRLGPSPESAAPVTVYERRLAVPASAGFVLFTRVLPMPAGAVLADGLLMFNPHVVPALPPNARAREVFAVWATDVLASDGYLSTAPHHSARQPPNSQSSASGATTEPPKAKPFTDSAGESRSDHSTGPSQTPAQAPKDTEISDKLLDRVRKLFAMAQETEASPHEAEIALRRCQSLMAKFGITEKDLETSEFGQQVAHPGKRVPMHIQYLSIAVAKLHDVLFVSGGGTQAHFRGYDIDVRVARLTLDYLSDAVERSLTARRRTGKFPAGRMAAYDYRLAFADEVLDRVNAIVSERKAEERTVSPTGTSLTIRKLEIVERECGQGLATSTVRARGAIDAAAAGAGREDGSRVSLNPQVRGSGAPALLGSD